MIIDTAIADARRRDPTQFFAYAPRLYARGFFLPSSIILLFFPIACILPGSGLLLMRFDADLSSFRRSRRGGGYPDIVSPL